jgi:hypothetical protein
MAGVQPGFIRHGGRNYPTNSAVPAEPRDQRYKDMSVTQALSGGSSKPSMILDASGNPYQNAVIPARMGGAIGKASGDSKVGYNTRESYPFIDFSAFSKNFYKMPFHYAMVRLFSLYRTPAEDRENILSKCVGAVSDFEKKKHEQSLSTELMNAFPKIMVWNDFANSASVIEEVYTVQWGRKEIPIHIRAKDGPEATDETLSEAIKYVRDKKNIRNTSQSPYNADAMHSLESFYRKGFSRLAADKYSRGDYGTFIDPSRFNPWFVRDDTWYIQQSGTTIKTGTVDVDGVTYDVRGYKKPSKANMWWYWFVGDKIYDFIDGFFDPIQRATEQLFSTDAQQSFVRGEYKMIAGIRRSIFDVSGRLDLAYDLSKADEAVVPSSYRLAA